MGDLLHSGFYDRGIDHRVVLHGNPSAVTADIPQEPFSERSGTTLRLQHCHILYGWPL